MNVLAESGSAGRSEYIEPNRVDESFIVERVYSAVMEHRLAPSTKLSELKLCEMFGVGRMHVRRALLLLANQGIVDLEANRGAFVASPDPTEANEVFEARSLIEPAIARRVVADIGPDNLEMLRQHILLESNAREHKLGADLIRLSGEFHVKLAEATGNTILRRVVRELVTRSSLIVGLFGTSNHKVCPKDEHSSILNSIECGDPDTAETQMCEHLNRIREGLNFSAPRHHERDLAEILGLK